MIRKIVIFGACLLMTCMGMETFCKENGYENLSVAVYFRYQETQSNGIDTTQLAAQWAEIEKQVHVDKVYLETTRNRELATEEAVVNLKKFFAERGITTSGALGLTVNEMNGFQTFCFTDPADREKVKSMVQFTARHFDEIILDDFFFNNSKTDSDIAAKGDRSWTQFRTELMAEVSKNLILGPAKEINPNVRIIIKYPNWYESFQALGYDLAVQPKMFDAIYTGTETRNADFGQRLQSYQSYLQTRYLDNIKPGGNQGGWIDGGTDIERYAEQFWNTLFAKVPEITLFNSQQITGDISGRRERIEADANSSLANLFAPVTLPDGSTHQPGNVARIAGYSAEMLDRFLGKLGKPVGVATYKPCNSVGEEYLPTFFGTIGIPVDLVPDFPEKAETVFLTRASAADRDLVEKTKKLLQAGGQAIVTSGLVEALGENGFQDIAEISVTGRVMATNFSSGFGFFGGFGGSAAPKAQEEESDLNIILPKLRHFENDTWNSILFNTANFGYPMVVGAERSTTYGKGTFYVIGIPDDFAALYRLPETALNQIRSLFNRNMWVSLEAPDHVSLFPYDNRTFIVQNYREQPVDTRLTMTEAEQIRDLLTDQLISGQTGGGNRKRGFGGMMMGGGAGGRDSNQASFDVTVPGHSFRVFVAE